MVTTIRTDAKKRIIPAPRKVLITRSANRAKALSFERQNLRKRIPGASNALTAQYREYHSEHDGQTEENRLGSGLRCLVFRYGDLCGGSNQYKSQYGVNCRDRSEANRHPS